MKTYGKKGFHIRPIDRLSTNVANFSDDEVETTDIGSEGTTEIEPLEAKLVVATSKPGSTILKHQRDSEDDLNATCKSKDSKKLDFFSFLEDTPVPKRRKTHSFRKESAKNNEDSSDDYESNINSESFRSTIDGINELLSSIKGAEKGELVLTDKLQDNNNVEQHEAAGTYGSTRTMLCREEDESIQGSASENEEYQGKGEGEPQMREKDDGATHHFNQLKVMGESLKFEDELEFLMSDADKNIQSFTSRLLTLSLDILNNDELRAYIMKYQHKDVWNWCFKVSDPHNAVLLYIQAVIATIIPLDDRQNLWYRLDIDDFILPLTSQKIVIENIEGTKFMQLNYRDLLAKTERRTGLYYALTLWPKCQKPDRELSEIQYSTIINLLKNQTERMDMLLEVVEVIIPNEFPMKLSKRCIDLFNILSQMLEQLTENETLIKSLIKLTNNRTIISSLPTKQRVDLLKRSLSYIANAASVFESQSSSRDSGLAILHLGLALNLILDLKDASLQIHYDVLHELKKKYHKILSRIAKFNFGENMYLLVFIYVSKIANISLDSVANVDVYQKLHDFSSEVKMYNKSIYFGIQALLDTI